MCYRGTFWREYGAWAAGESCDGGGKGTWIVPFKVRGCGEDGTLEFDEASAEGRNSTGVVSNKEFH